MLPCRAACRREWPRLQRRWHPGGLRKQPGWHHRRSLERERARRAAAPTPPHACLGAKPWRGSPPPASCAAWFALPLRSCHATAPRRGSGAPPPRRPSPAPAGGVAHLQGGQPARPFFHVQHPRLLQPVPAGAGRPGPARGEAAREAAPHSSPCRSHACARRRRCHVEPRRRVWLARDAHLTRCCFPHRLRRLACASCPPLSPPPVTPN